MSFLLKANFLRVGARSSPTFLSKKCFFCLCIFLVENFVVYPMTFNLFSTFFILRITFQKNILINGIELLWHL